MSQSGEGLKNQLFDLWYCADVQPEHTLLISDSRMTLFSVKCSSKLFILNAMQSENRQCVLIF